MLKFIFITILSISYLSVSAQNYKNFDTVDFMYKLKFVKPEKEDTVKIKGYLIRPLDGRRLFFLPIDYLKYNTVDDYFENYIRKNLEGEEEVVDTIMYNINFKVGKHILSWPFLENTFLEKYNKICDEIFLFDNFNYDRVYRYKKKMKYEKYFSIYYLEGEFLRLKIPSYYHILPTNSTYPITRDKFKEYTYYCILLNTEFLNFKPVRPNEFTYENIFKKILDVKQIK